MSKFVDAYDKTTGRKLEHPVPESYFDLFSNLRKTPVAKAAEKQPTQATTSTSKKEN